MYSELVFINLTYICIPVQKLGGGTILGESFCSFEATSLRIRATAGSMSVDFS